MYKAINLKEAFGRLFKAVSKLRESLEDERTKLDGLIKECSSRKITVSHKTYLIELLNKRKETVLKLLNVKNESFESLKPYRPQ